MSARVNLLPGTVAESNAQSRQRILAGFLVVVVLLALVGATVWQRMVLQDAEDELAEAQTELSAARAEVAALAAFQDLEAELQLADSLVANALGDEATLAGVLQDLALITPTEGAFTSLSLNLEQGDGGSVGSLTANAEVLESHAPGVERFLLQLERAAGFRAVFPGGSTIDEDDIATFSVSVQLGPEYKTQRYVDGLPEVTR